MPAPLNRNLAAAIEYRRLGLPVLPVVGKAPIVSGWSRTRAARTNELYRWFYSHPKRNVGLRMGGGLVAIDIDSRSGGFSSWDSLCNGRPIPFTAKAITGGNGRHYLFWVPVAVGCYQGLFGLPGIDAKGEGGQIVVEPSINPETSGAYRWLIHPREAIARIPDWLLDAILIRPDESPAEGHVGGVGRLRSGDVGCLAAEVIKRFPMTGHGTRGGQFALLVPSLVGRGFDDATVQAVVMSWWADGYRRGLCRTGPEQVPDEVGRYVERLRRSDRFRTATPKASHREQCRAIQLPSEAYAMMTDPTPTDERAKEIEYNTGVTLTNRRLCDRLCGSADEVAFVEALLVQAHHCLAMGMTDAVRMTGDQLREIAADRHPGTAWSNEQLDRLKRKYIDRPDKPATVHSLLRQTTRGRKAARHEPARPSEYAVTGLATLIGLRTCDEIEVSADEA